MAGNARIARTCALSHLLATLLVRFMAGSHARPLLSTAGGAWVIPEFVETGMGDPALPPGIHKASVDEIRAALVDAFPESTSRSRLLGGWLAFRLSVRRLVPVEYEYLDGSFVTGKLNPKDIDLSLWINRSDLEAAPPDNRAGITTLRRQRLSFGCDVLFVFVCPTSHPKYREFEHFRDWTENAWRTYRTGTRELTTAVSKGYIEVSDDS
jgi:hypothetical protein